MKSKSCRNDWPIQSSIDISILAWKRHNFSSFQLFQVIIVVSIISIGLIYFLLFSSRKYFFSFLLFHANANSCQKLRSMEKKEVRCFLFLWPLWGVAPEMPDFILIARTLIFIFLASILFPRDGASRPRSVIGKQTTKVGRSPGRQRG